MTSAAPTDLTVTHLDPRTLLLDRNIRDDAALDPGFVASIRDHGVLVPIIAVHSDGGIRVRDGHRRTLAAITADRDTVPVIIAGTDGDTDDDHIARIVEQWVTNEHRTAISDTDRYTTLAQLAAFGLSATQIAKRTQTPRRRVKAALAVAGSEAARGAAHSGDLTLDELAVLAEFDDDPDAVTTLLEAAASGQFPHAVQRLRDRRAEQAERRALADQLTAQGVRVIEEPDPAGPARGLRRLAHDGAPLTTEGHTACPGHAAYVTSRYDYQPRASASPADVGDSDGPADAAALDPDSSDDAETPVDDEEEATPPSGGGVFAATVAIAEYVCTDPETHGHTDRWAALGGGGTARRNGPMTDQEKAERREVIDNNKAWKSATTVRREWLRAFLTRRTPPKGVSRFIATCLLTGGYELRRALESHHDLLRGLLGTDETPLGGGQLAEQVATATESRAQTLALGMVLAAFEAHTGPDTWRRVTPTARRYFAALREWGYALSDIEALVLAPTDLPSASDDTDPPEGTGPNDAAEAAGSDLPDPPADGGAATDVADPPAAA